LYSISFEPEIPVNSKIGNELTKLAKEKIN
jgi:hypothetical protein